MVFKNRISRYLSGLCVVLLIGVALVLSQGCSEKKKYNPLDPNNPDYKKPQITILSLDDGTVVKVDSLQITWKANFPQYCEYRHRFLPDSLWSAWSKDTLLKESFADGDYIFQTAVRYTGFTDTTMSAARFTIQTLPDSSLYLYPGKQFITTAAPATSFTFCCKKIDSCNAIRLKLSGVIIDSARLIGFNAPCFTNKDSINLIITDNSNMFLCGTKQFLTVYLRPIINIDTTHVEISSISIRKIKDVQDTVVVKKTKGALIIKK